MTTKIDFQLIPLQSIAQPPFDFSKLPFPLMAGVNVEDVSALLPYSLLAYMKETVGSHRMRFFEGNVKHAIVHRHQEHPQTVANWEEVQKHQERNAELINEVFVCSRIVRPTRRHGSVAGELREDGKVDVRGTTFPDSALDVPEGQKLFEFRNVDLELLRKLLPPFLNTMHGEYWPFRMAVQYYHMGYEMNDWKGRYLYWGSSAIHALYSYKSEKLVERVRAFLGESTLVYDPADHPEFEFLEPVALTLGEVLDDINEVRNCIAHGVRISDKFFGPDRSGINGAVNRISVLDDALGFIMRESLKKILLGGDVSHFKDRTTVSKFWKAQGL